jgi:fructoselysine 6-kinase
VAVFTREFNIAVAYLGNIGDDFWGRKLRKQLLSYGIEASGYENFLSPTPKTILYQKQDGDRFFISSETSVEKYPQVRLSPLELNKITGVKIVHTSIYSNLDHELARLAKMGILISYDASDCYTMHALPSIIPYCRFLLCSQSGKTVAESREFCLLLRTMNNQLDIFCTRGSEQGIAMVDGTEYPIIPYKTDRLIIDTTGAGDRFIATILAKKLECFRRNGSWVQTPDLNRSMIDIAAKAATDQCYRIGCFGNGFTLDIAGE